MRRKKTYFAEKLYCHVSRTTVNGSDDVRKAFSFKMMMMMMLDVRGKVEKSITRRRSNAQTQFQPEKSFADEIFFY